MTLIFAYAFVPSLFIKGTLSFYERRVVQRRTMHGLTSTLYCIYDVKQSSSVPMAFKWLTM